MFVDRRYDRREYEKKLRVVLRAFAGVEQIDARVRGKRPVVVFSASVDSVEGLFVKKASHIVL